MACLDRDGDCWNTSVFGLGFGLLLVRVAQKVKSANLVFLGQEPNGSIGALCRMSMFLPAMDNARSQHDKHVLFINTSREYEDGMNQNRLRDCDIDKIIKTYKAFKAIDKYAFPASLAEIQGNEFNLNIPRYVDTFEPEPEVDIPATRREITALEKELVQVQKEMDKYLKELGL